LSFHIKNSDKSSVIRKMKGLVALYLACIFLAQSLEALVPSPSTSRRQGRKQCHVKQSQAFSRPLKTSPIIASLFGCLDDRNEEEEPPRKSWSGRRQFLWGSVALISSPVWRSPPKAKARGLVQFPVDDPRDMLNTYHFLRVGETLLEAEDIWSTNPLFL